MTYNVLNGTLSFYTTTATVQPYCCALQNIFISADSNMWCLNLGVKLKYTFVKRLQKIV